MPRIDELIVSRDVQSDCVYLNSIQEVILDAQQLGVTLAKLKRLVQIKHPSYFEHKMSTLLRLLDILVDSKLVLSVGVVERVYVAHEFKQHWVIQSYKNQKGRGFVSPSTSSESKHRKKDDRQNGEPDEVGRLFSPRFCI
jgi:hypothetical protein